MRSSTLLALAASLSTSVAAAPKGPFQGFNYGSTHNDGSAMSVQDFKDSFNLAKSLTPDGAFSSARVYTMIQQGTYNETLSAIQAANDTQTPILLGMWTSSTTDPDATFNVELNVLKNIIKVFGEYMAPYIVGISVGSEDLYRNTPMGIAAKEGPGNSAAAIASYIHQTKQALVGTAWSGVKVGHVDTSTAWANDTNAAVWEAADFIGQDAYPFWQSTDSNSIDNAVDLWNIALEATMAHTGKSADDIWATETGWAVKGPSQNLAVASPENAQTYYRNVGCDLLFGKKNTWWFSLQSADMTKSIVTDSAGNPAPDFSVADIYGKPYFNMTCNAASSSSSSSSSASATATSSSASKSSATVIVGGSDSNSGSSSATSTKSSSGSSASAIKGSSGSSVWSTYSSATGIVATASGSATIISPGANTTVVSATLSTAQATTPLSTPTSASASTSPSSTGVSTSGANGLSGSFLGAIGAIVAALIIL